MIRSRMYVLVLLAALPAVSCSDVLGPDAGQYALVAFTPHFGSSIAVPGAYPWGGDDSVRMIRGHFRLTSACEWTAQWERSEVVSGVDGPVQTIDHAGSCAVSSRSGNRTVLDLCGGRNVTGITECEVILARDTVYYNRSTFVR